MARKTKQQKIDELELRLQEIDEAEKARVKKEAEDKKKRWSAVVYCTNCMEVNSVSIPPEVEVERGDCVTCRARGHLRLVRKVNCDRTF